MQIEGQNSRDVESRTKGSKKSGRGWEIEEDGPVNTGPQNRAQTASESWGGEPGPDYSLATQSRRQSSLWSCWGAGGGGAAEKNRRCFLNNREKSREWM